MDTVHSNPPPSQANWWVRARGVAGALFRLTSADIRLARAATLRACAYAALAFLFVATAWAALSGGAVLLLIEAGLSWPLALLALFAVCAALAAALLLRARSLFRMATLSSTRRQLDELLHPDPSPAVVPSQPYPQEMRP